MICTQLTKASLMARSKLHCTHGVCQTSLLDVHIVGDSQISLKSEQIS